MTTYPLHLPTVHIDVQKICHNFNLLETLSKACQASENEACAIAKLPKHFGKNHVQGFVWPKQLAVIKADAYGHGQKECAQALLKNGVQMFASGSVQECADLREHIDSHIAILNLLGPITQEDINLCATLGIIPVIHSVEQINLLKGLPATLPIAIKCNTGMSRLGFDAHELVDAITELKQLPFVMPVLALSHLHSADSVHTKDEIKKQGLEFAQMLKVLRKNWPSLAASLANSAGTIFADEISTHIGAHICRPGIALYGSNPFYNTEFSTRAKDLLPSMWVSAPILGTRTLSCGQGIGYGHTFVAKQSTRVAIIACGYADGFSRGLTNKGLVCVAGQKVPLIGRVSMQMFAADITSIKEEKPQEAWLLGGPYAEAIPTEELAALWGTISYEVLCALGNNVRKYTKFDSL